MEMNRRDFLKSAAAVGGFAAFTGLTGCSTGPAEAGAAATTTLPDATPIPPVKPPATWDAEADVVVVGTGGGGLNAAVYAAEHGASVIAIDKQAQVGGATRHAAGYVVMAGGTKAQNEVGYGWPTFPLDPNAAVSAANRQFQYSLDDKLQRALIVGAGEATNWLFAHKGVNMAMTPDHAGFVDMDIILGKQNAVLGMNNTVNAQEANAKAASARFMLSTKTEALVAQDGKILGVVTSDNATGARQYVKANKGVILCAGGIGMNKDLLKKYIPTGYEACAAGGPGADAHRRGLPHGPRRGRGRLRQGLLVRVGGRHRRIRRTRGRRLLALLLPR